MADQNAVQVVIGADIASLRAGAREASDHVNGIVSQLRDFKSEAVSTGRTARFFAADLAEIIPGADGAKGALKDLIAVGLSGSAFGAAVEGVKLVVGILKELGAESAKAEEDFKKFVEESKKQSEDLQKSVQRILLEMQGATRAQLMLFDQTFNARKREGGLVDELKKAEENLLETKARANEVDAEEVATAVVAVSAAQGRIDKLKEELVQVRAIIDEKKKGVGPVGEADATKAAQDARAKDAEDLAKWRSFQLTEWKKYYDQQTKLATDAVQAEFDARAKEALDEAKIRADEMKELKKHNDQVTKETTDSLQAEFDAQDKKTKQIAASIDHVFKSTFHSIIDGTKSVGAAMADMVKGLGEAIVDSLLKKAAEAIAASLVGTFFAHKADVTQTEGNIATAATGAAAAVADIPIVGPALAIAAANMVRADLQSMADPLLSAAGGADLPSGGPFPMIAHSREMMLPEEHADVIRGLAAGGGGGGMELHFHGTVIDAAAVKHFVNSDEFRNAVAGARRSGRLSF